MSYTPLVRWRNFTLENLKAMLEVYPDMTKALPRLKAAEEIEAKLPGYTRTAYQFACQLGIECRTDNLKVQNYLYTFDDDNLSRYLEFWFKMYVAPNPYVQSKEDPICIFKTLADEILASDNKEISYTDFCNRHFGDGKSSDILKNAMDLFAKPIVVNNDRLYLPKDKTEELYAVLEKVNSTLPMENNKSELEFFNRFSYPKFCEFYNLPIDVSPKEKKDIDVINRESRKDPIHPLNQIIYGAPGTGKTFSSIEYALAIIEQRPVNLEQKSKEDRKALIHKYEDYVKKGQIIFTTFHQSYGYEEFIQGIRPNPNAGAVNFITHDGVFKKIADRALPNQEDNYVIIIDEINRGNISKIFGELITLIEEDKRYGELNQLSITLPLGGGFTVPNNLYIIGTMNSADKSISLIDTALRRRFEFVEMAPDESFVENPMLRKTLVSLNIYLKKELRSTDLLIGHSFFLGKSSEALGDIMNRNIIPLLYEYFYDDEAKVKKALECLDGTEFVINNECKGRTNIKKKVL